MVKFPNQALDGGRGSCQMSILILEYPCCLSLKVLEKGPMTEFVVFFHKHTVLDVLAFYLSAVP